MEQRLHVECTDAQEVRASIRDGGNDGPTSGLAPGFAQANLVILPEEYAFDFLRFCVRNPKPCPVLEVTEVGSPEPAVTAPGSDLRTDVPKYCVYENRELVEESGDILHRWRDDLVGFLTGCSFTFEAALSRLASASRTRSRGVTSRCTSRTASALRRAHSTGRWW